MRRNISCRVSFGDTIAEPFSSKKEKLPLMVRQVILQSGIKQIVSPDRTE